MHFLQKEHAGFLEEFGKQINKAKKEVFASLHELLKAAEEEACKDYEVEVTSFMKSVHMDVTSKLKGLEKQRQQTEERVLSVLERVVLSCVPADNAWSALDLITLNNNINNSARLCIYLWIGEEKEVF